MQFRTAMAGLCLGGLASCATVTRGSDEELRIESRPTGAAVRASTGWQCVTPCTVAVGRRTAFALDVEMPGYLPRRVILRAEIDGKGQAGLGGNILVGGLIGAAIDGASGAMYSHGENPLVIDLRPVPPGDGGAAAVD